eukprot:jgi/Mesen1/1463/ME000132S00411
MFFSFQCTSKEAEAHDSNSVVDFELRDDDTWQEAPHLSFVREAHESKLFQWQECREKSDRWRRLLQPAGNRNADEDHHENPEEEEKEEEEEEPLESDSEGLQEASDDERAPGGKARSSSGRGGHGDGGGMAKRRRTKSLGEAVGWEDEEQEEGQEEEEEEGEEDEDEDEEDEEEDDEEEEEEEGDGEGEEEEHSGSRRETWSGAFGRKRGRGGEEAGGRADPGRPRAGRIRRQGRPRRREEPSASGSEDEGQERRRGRGRPAWGSAMVVGQKLLTSEQASAFSAAAEAHDSNSVVDFELRDDDTWQEAPHLSFVREAHESKLFQWQECREKSDRWRRLLQPAGNRNADEDHHENPEEEEKEEEEEEPLESDSEGLQEASDDERAPGGKARSSSGRGGHGDGGGMAKRRRTKSLGEAVGWEDEEQEEGQEEEEEEGEEDEDEDEEDEEEDDEEEEEEEGDGEGEEEEHSGSRRETWSGAFGRKRGRGGEEAGGRADPGRPRAGRIRRQGRPRRREEPSASGSEDEGQERRRGRGRPAWGSAMVVGQKLLTSEQASAFSAAVRASREMHRNPALLDTWAARLSAMNPLKNWINNRKHRRWEHELADTALPPPENPQKRKRFKQQSAALARWRSQNAKKQI